MGNTEKTARVKDRIAEAFIGLLKERHFDKITIVDIINAAEVGRVSFYRNFENKDDILRYYINYVTDKWLLENTENYVDPLKGKIKKYIVFLFTHMYEYRDITDILIKNGKMHLMEDEFDKRFFAKLSECSSQWQIAYKAGGVYKLFRYWAETGYKKTPQEIAELIK